MQFQNQHSGDKIGKYIKNIFKTIVSIISIVVAVIVGLQGGNLISSILFDKIYTVEDINKELNKSIENNFKDIANKMKVHMNDNYELITESVHDFPNKDLFPVNLAKYALADQACKSCEKIGKLMKRDDIVYIYQYYTNDRELLAELKYNKYGYINENNEVEKIEQDKNKLFEFLNVELSKFADSLQNEVDDKGIEEINVHLNEDYDIIMENVLQFGYYITDYTIMKNIGEGLGKMFCLLSNLIFQNDNVKFFYRIYSSDKKLLKEYKFDVNGIIE